MTSQPTSGPQESNVPAIRSFEFGEKSIGAIKASVNRFRGTVSLPIDLFTLEGRPGLDVKISLLYQSSIKHQVDTWNVDAPTGILGLGWQMPYEFIAVDKNGSGSPTSDRYFLVTGGSANPMAQVGETPEGRWQFELRNYQFWSILYDPKVHVWEITKEDGSVYAYGAEQPDANAVQWGVKWGNWLGNSSRLDGQESYPISWNLASITSLLGHRVSYSYENVDFAVGDRNGRRFTQASYIKRIVDSLGREVTFLYGKKYGARNPSSEGKVEYQASNGQRPEPNAYQDRYETRYLDSIEVKNSGGEVIYGLQFTYDFLNFSPTSHPHYGLFWKRCLRSVFQWSQGEQALPSMLFEYNEQQQDFNRGALRKITYPSGGEATVAYKQKLLDAPKRVVVENPLPGGGRAGVWQGEDYVALTFASQAGLRLLVYSWNGRWVAEDLPLSLGPGAIDPDSVWVAAAADYLALAVRDPGATQELLYLFRKDSTGFGKWELNPAGVQRLSLRGANPAASTFVAGTDYVIAANPDYAGRAFQGFSWDWKRGIWSPPSIVPSSSDAREATGISLAAFGNYYVVAFYFQNRRQLRLQTLYRDSVGAWHGNSPWINGDMDVQTLDSRLLFNWTVQPGYAVATYITGSDAGSIRYSLRIFQFDEEFRPLNAADPKVVDLETTVSGGEARFEVFLTRAAAALVNNNPANLRNEGGKQTDGASANWRVQNFPLAEDSEVAFTSGDDVAVVTQSAGTGGPKNQLLVFDPNQPGDSAWAFDANVDQQGNWPTVTANYLTVGRRIYFRDSGGAWKLLSTQLNNLSNEESVQNQAPSYIAYQDRSDASTRSYLVRLANGEAEAPVEIPGGTQKVAVPRSEAGPGTVLAGPRFLITYPSNESFSQVSRLTLFNLDDGDLSEYATDYPVAWLAIDNPFDPEASFEQSFFYSNSGQAQIAYDSATGVVQYPRVTSIAGVRSTAELPPPTQPEGRSEFYYSNGLSPQADLGYPVGWIYNYQEVLNGMLLAQKDFDSQGRLVGDQLNYWEVYTTEVASGQRLWGGYARPVRATVTRDGVTEDSTSGFDQRSGLETWTEQIYSDAQGAAKKLFKRKLYAWRVPEYASLFEPLHCLSAVARIDRSVIDGSSGHETFIESRATTWKDWSTDGREPSAAAKTPRPARWQAFQWKAEGERPDFPFGEGDRSGWVLLSEVLERTEPDYLISEQVDTRGTASSFVYDRNQRYLVASFPGGSVTGSEARYWGAEPYEENAGWELGSGASIVSEDGTGAADAHTGEWCVALAAGTTGMDGMSIGFKPQRPGSYGFSAWVKKPEGFLGREGEARFLITVGSAAPVIVEFPVAVGAWVHLSARFNVAVGDAVTILGENANRRLPVRVDDLCFAPWDCGWTATSYDTRLWLPAARVEANGETSRKVYDGFGRTVLTTNAADRLSEITGPYMSRQGNQDQFSTADPDHTVVIRPAESGSLSTFTRGAEWQRIWEPGPADVWEISDGQLRQKQVATAGTLALRLADHRLGFTVAARLTPDEEVTAPMGIRIGADITVEWDPELGSWKLEDRTGSADPARGPDPVRFTVPADRFECSAAEKMNSGNIPETLPGLFARAGLHLAPGGAIAPIAPSGRWDLAVPGAIHRYDLRLRDGALEVVQVGGSWTLLIRGRTLLFWVDSKLIFSHVAADVIVGAPELFFGTRVAVAALAAGLGPAAAVTYTDTAGNPLQEQGLEGERMVVNQKLTDNQGRLAVDTKPAWIDASTSPLLQFCETFAKLDWTSGRMTGLLSQAYPEDDGYPYAREIYETSPLSRAVEQGLPGTAFRVGAHSTRYTYGSNDGSLGLPPNRYIQETVTDPNGDLAYRINTVLGQVVYKISERLSGGADNVKSFSLFDDAGNAVELRSPNYYRPPENSSPADWVVRQTFDYAGRLLTTRTSNIGETQMVYSPSGDLRFMQQPQGAADENYVYWKYDRLGRQVETGYLNGPWNRATLQQKADLDPDWPPTPATWRRKFLWDGDRPEQLSVGRVHAIDTNNGDSSDGDVRESYEYDAFGNTAAVEQTVEGFSGSQRVDYGFDDVGKVLTVAYPEAQGRGERWVLHYRYDTLRRIREIAEQEDFAAPLVSYAYGPDGRPTTEVFNPAGVDPITRTLKLNSPLWPTSLDARNSTNSVVFREELSYTEGGYDGAAYYDGLVAAASYSAGDGSQGHGFCYSYSALGEICNAESTERPEWNLGVVDPVTYDSNGNIETAPRGGSPRRYDYLPGAQCVDRVVDPQNSSVIASYDYNANGAVLKSDTAASPFAPARRLTFTYDPSLGRATHVAEAAGLKASFRYGASGERIVKELTGIGLGASKLYVRGANQLPLFERTVMANDADALVESCYAFGPGGLVAMRRGGRVYGVLKDHLGSVRRVMAPDGTVVASYDYLTFGTVGRKVEPEEGFMPYLFTGQELDEEIGLYNYRARFYSSELGRFLDVDPARQFFSPYLYAANNPVLYIDPTGAFSLKSLFSAVGGALIGGFEILAGVAIDTVAGVLDVVTGGLSTPASLALASLAGAFYGAGVSSIVYSVLNVQSFDWKEYGIQMGIGAVGGAITFGFGALGSAAAEGATGVKAAIEAGEQVSNLTRAANVLIDSGVNAAGGFISGVASTGISDASHNVNPGFDVVEGGLWAAASIGLGTAIPGPSYKAGWGNLGKRVLVNITKNEAIGASLNTIANAIHGDALEKGLTNSLVGRAVWGGVGSIKAEAAAKQALKLDIDFKFDPDLGEA